MGFQAPFLMMVVGLVICLASDTYAEQGLATYYAPPYVPSACFGNEEHGTMIAGVSDGIWNNGGACGTRYRVNCTGPANQAPHPCKGSESIVVEIVDHCASCNGTINLSQDAFSQIADLNAGLIKIEYEQVEADVQESESLGGAVS